MIARCEHHKKIAEIAAPAVAQPSDILNAGQGVVGIAAYCEKISDEPRCRGRGR
jgi:hypothetical protein